MLYKDNPLRWAFFDTLCRYLTVVVTRCTVHAITPPYHSLEEIVIHELFNMFNSFNSCTEPILIAKILELLALYRYCCKEIFSLYLIFRPIQSRNNTHLPLYFLCRFYNFSQILGLGVWYICPSLLLTCEHLFTIRQGTIPHTGLNVFLLVKQT